MVTINISGKVLTIIVIILLISGTSLFTYHTFFKKTGYASYDGFSSYEEMMEAHHGSGSSGSGMAGHHGGESQGTGSCGVQSTGQQTSIEQGEMTSYGLTLDENGYQELLNYDSSIKLDSNQMKNYVGLNVHLPQCCDFKLLQESGNCGCGHHIALSGLAKLLITKGYSKEQIQQEIDKWKLIFYPEGSTGTGEC